MGMGMGMGGSVRIESAEKKQIINVLLNTLIFTLSNTSSNNNFTPAVMKKACGKLINLGKKVNLFRVKGLDVNEKLCQLLMEGERAKRASLLEDENTSHF